jgi:hypothetical protein
MKARTANLLPRDMGEHGLVRTLITVTYPDFIQHLGWLTQSRRRGAGVSRMSATTKGPLGAMGGGEQCPGCKD